MIQSLEENIEWSVDEALRMRASARGIRALKRAILLADPDMDAKIALVEANAALILESALVNRALVTLATDQRVAQA
jgi:hypothetical protein